MKMHDNLITALADGLPRVVGKVHLGESVGVYGLLGQALYAQRADVLFLVSGYVGGTMDAAQIRKTDNLDCVKADPGIQSRVFASWIARAPDLAKYPLIIILHCIDDKLASFSDMALLQRWEGDLLQGSEKCRQAQVQVEGQFPYMVLESLGEAYF